MKVWLLLMLLAAIRSRSTGKKFLSAFLAEGPIQVWIKFKGADPCRTLKLDRLNPV